MLKPVALFINGVFEEVLEDILQVQEVLPEHIMFLQPYAGKAIKQLRDNPPSIESPMRLFASTTADLANVHYQAEIVGWEDKTLLTERKKQVINRLIAALQVDRELYNASQNGTKESVNLLYVRRLQKLNSPFSVSHLIKISDQQPLSTARTQAGGWSYVKSERLTLSTI